MCCRPVLKAALQDAKQRSILDTRHRNLHFKMLASLPGCKQQKWHKDIRTETLAHSSLPLLSLIVAISDKTVLKLKYGADIILSTGDYVVFGSRVVHCGSAYTKAHVRLFSYIGPKDFPIPNKTDYDDKYSDSESEGDACQSFHEM